MSSLNNKQLLRSLPFYNINIDTFSKKLRIKKDLVIKPRINNKQIVKRKNKYKKSNIFKYALPFNNDYVNRNLLENLHFYYNESEKSKRKPKNDKYIKNKKIRRLRDRKKITKKQLLLTLPFYEEILVNKREHAFKGSAETYHIEVYDRLDLRKSFIQAKRSITNFLKEILKEKRGLKYTIITKILMKRQESNNTWRYTTIYLRSNAITVTSQRFYLNDAFNNIYDLLDKWQSEGSGWITGEIDGIHININKYEPLVGSSYLPLPRELQNSSKRLIDIKNKDIYCFKCHIRMFNPQNKNAERINKVDKEIAKTLDYPDIKFPIKEKQYSFIEKRFNMNINVFKYDKYDI